MALAGSKSSESEDESGDEYTDSSSEEENTPRLNIRPKFIPKSQRNKPPLEAAVMSDTPLLASAKTSTVSSKTATVQTTANTVENDDVARRLADTDTRLEEMVERDRAAEASGKRYWDDASTSGDSIDTTDNVDVEAEEAAWRLRELRRIQRDRHVIEERERERAEVERRRNLTEDERRHEDAEYLARQLDEKESRSKMAYKQQYFHGGAFYMTDDAKADLLKRNIMGSRIQDDVKDRSVLPAYLQQRNMAKLGRKGATKYRDMRSEDTGHWGRLDDDDGRGRGGRGGSGGVGGGRDDVDDERFRPDDCSRRNGPAGNGANALPLGERRPREDGRAGDDGRISRYRDRDRGDQQYETRDDGRKDRDRDRDGFRSRDDDKHGRERDREKYRDRDRERDKYGDRNRRTSRSWSRPPRDDRGDRDDYRNRRKRSMSRDRRDRFDSDKRRRMEAR